MKRSSPGFLGITIAENVIASAHPDWTRMPPNNPKFDFVLPTGEKIDVKAAMPSGKSSARYWNFVINGNGEADDFIFMAFDKQDSLSLCHVWIVPGNVVCHKYSVMIKDSEEWRQFECPAPELQAAFCDLCAKQNIDVCPTIHLPKITISISEEDRTFLNEHPEIRPSGVFRAAMQDIRILHNTRRGRE